MLCNRTLIPLVTNSNQLGKYNVNLIDSISFINDDFLLKWFYFVYLRNIKIKYDVC